MLALSLSLAEGKTTVTSGSARSTPRVAKAGVPGWAVTLLGWQPWAIARVAAFATLGVLLAEPLVTVVFPSARERLKANTRAAYIVAAMSGILADWFFKFLLAPAWGRWLRSLLP